MATTEGSSVIVIISIPWTVVRDKLIAILALRCVGEFSHDNDADYWPGLQLLKYILKEAQNK